MDASFQFDALSEESPALAGMYSAGVQGRVSMGQRAGRRVMRVGSNPDALWVVSRTLLQAHLDGFDLHAAVSVGAGDPGRSSAAASDPTPVVPAKAGTQNPWHVGGPSGCPPSRA
jgi:hypothetical protein